MTKRKKSITASPTSPPFCPVMDPNTNAIMDKLHAMSCQSNEILQRLDKQDAAMADIRAQLEVSQQQNLEKDKIILRHSDQLNQCEQALRSTSLRILGLPVSKTTPTADIISIVHENILLPILQAAKDNGEIESFPTKRFLVDSAFAIPSKNHNACPVIIKLTSSVVRSMVFQYKKDILPTTSDPSSGKTRPRFSIYEDLTPANFAQFRAFSEDPRTTSIWTFNGQLKFHVKDRDTIFKVRSLQDTVDSLTKT
jgi:hypothetical protein